MGRETLGFLVPAQLGPPGGVLQPPGPARLGGFGLGPEVKVCWSFG